MCIYVLLNRQHINSLTENKDIIKEDMQIQTDDWQVVMK